LCDLWSGWDHVQKGGGKGDNGQLHEDKVRQEVAGRICVNSKRDKPMSSSEGWQKNKITQSMCMSVLWKNNKKHHI